MNERLRILRKEHLHLTLEKFGEPLGVQNSAISKIENGRTNLTDQMILAICRTYNVNEAWLREGSGPVFRDLSEDDALAVALASVSTDPFIRSLLIEYCNLDSENKKLFWDFLSRIVDRARKEPE